jgi:hypothetical protein
MGDEARSDVALTVAALVFGPLLLGGLRGGSGTLLVLLDVAVVLALTTLVPLLLVRSRAGGAAGGVAGGVAGGAYRRALALDGAPSGLALGVPLVVPVAVAGVVAMLTAGATPGAALLGRLSGAPLQLVQVAGLTVGTAVLVVFLVRRGAEAFPRSPDWTLRRLVRTLGMGAAGVALVAGLLRVPLGANPVRVVTNAAALAVLVLLADRIVVTGRAVPRLALFLPAGLALYLHLSAFGLSVGLQAGALAAGVTVVVGAAALGDRGTWSVLPLLIAVHLWPTCLSPLTLARGLC